MADYRERRCVTYCPAFAKAALNDVKNSIFQRMIDITREGGPRSYQYSITGENGGVDLLSSTMNSFIGREVLPDLLSISKIGVYVDAPALPGPTILDKGDLHPYIYTYCAEDIRSWTKDDSPNQNEFSSILLRDCNYENDPETGLPIGELIRFRYLWIGEDGFVYVRFYDENGIEEETRRLEITKIPFVIFQLSDSLLKDVANYQIALLNMSSTDVMYALKANFPFYTEQFDPRVQSPYIRREQESQETFGNSQIAVNPSPVIQSEEIKVGVSAGRRYVKDVERPGFIHPSPDPLRASMELGEKLKAEIRQLINLAITNLQPKMASAESKQMDNGSLENGLSYIGLELEAGERKIAEYWAMYEGKKAATINYPESYSLTSQSDRYAQAMTLKDLMPTVPSLLYQKEVAKRIAKTSVGTEVSIDTLRGIYTQIDRAPVVVCDPNVITLDLQNGLVSVETASLARGYPDGEVEQAKLDHTERLSRIASAQSPGGFNGNARGVTDLGIDPNAGSQEKAASRDTTKMSTPEDTTRGNGK